MGPLFVSAMQNQTKIKKNEFSFAMNGFDFDYSALDIGDPLYDRVEGGELAMVRVAMFDDFFWS